MILGLTAFGWYRILKRMLGEARESKLLGCACIFSPAYASLKKETVSAPGKQRHTGIFQGRGRL